ncbi:MAG: LacI family DNA-binding transcriptional regulator [Armatimonadota bacterium]
MVTVRQLAKIAGVSISTVSKALHNKPDVSPATCQRIKALAQLYQFEPQWTRQPRDAGHYGTLGCLVPSIAASFYSRVLQGIFASAFAESFHVVTLESQSDIQHFRMAIATFIEQQVAGLLISPGHRVALPNSELFPLIGSEIPVVCIDYPPAEPIADYVYPHEEQLAQRIIAYLFELGHRELAYVGSTDDNPRARALQQSARQFGLFLEMIVHDVVDESAALPLPFGHRASPSAVIGHTDREAAYVMHRLTQHNIAIPRDVSVLGCGNHYFAQFMSPPLTSVELFPEHIGHTAVELLLQRINLPEQWGSFKPQTVLIEPQLVLRQSCAHRHRTESH